MSEIILLSIEPEEFTGLSRIRSGTESLYPNPAALSWIQSGTGFLYIWTRKAYTDLSRIRSGTESVYPNPAAPFSGSSYFLTVSIGWYLCRYRRAVGVEVAGSRGGARARASSLVRRLVIRRVRHWAVHVRSWAVSRFVCLSWTS